MFSLTVPATPPVAPAAARRETATTENELLQFDPASLTHSVDWAALGSDLRDEVEQAYLFSPSATKAATSRLATKTPKRVVTFAASPLVRKVSAAPLVDNSGTSDGFAASAGFDFRQPATAAVGRMTDIMFKRAFEDQPENSLSPLLSPLMQVNEDGEDEDDDGFAAASSDFAFKIASPASGTAAAARQSMHMWERSYKVCQQEQAGMSPLVELAGIAEDEDDEEEGEQQAEDGNDPPELVRQLPFTAPPTAAAGAAGAEEQPATSAAAAAAPPSKAQEVASRLAALKLRLQGSVVAQAAEPQSEPEPEPEPVQSAKQHATTASMAARLAALRTTSAPTVASGAAGSKLALIKARLAKISSRHASEGGVTPLAEVATEAAVEPAQGSSAADVVSAEAPTAGAGPVEALATAAAAEPTTEEAATSTGSTVVVVANDMAQTASTDATPAEVVPAAAHCEAAPVVDSAPPVEAAATDETAATDEEVASTGSTTVVENDLTQAVVTEATPAQMTPPATTSEAVPVAAAVAPVEAAASVAVDATASSGMVEAAATDATPAEVTAPPAVAASPVTVAPEDGAPAVETADEAHASPAEATPPMATQAALTIVEGVPAEIAEAAPATVAAGSSEGAAASPATATTNSEAASTAEQEPVELGEPADAPVATAVPTPAASTTTHQGSAPTAPPTATSVQPVATAAAPPGTVTAPATAPPANQLDKENAAWTGDGPSAVAVPEVQCHNSPVTIKPKARLASKVAPRKSNNTNDVLKRARNVLQKRPARSTTWQRRTSNNTPAARGTSTTTATTSGLRRPASSSGFAVSKAKLKQPKSSALRLVAPSALVKPQPRRGFRSTTGKARAAGSSSTSTATKSKIGRPKSGLRRPSSIPARMKV